MASGRPPARIHPCLPTSFRTRGSPRGLLLLWGTNMDSIDTYYGGVMFRSRLEARWALFFDLVGVGWKYEKGSYETGQRYSVGNGRTLPEQYTPDFVLHRRAHVVEIKPANQYEEALGILANHQHGARLPKHLAFLKYADDCHHPFSIVFGNPHDNLAIHNKYADPMVFSDPSVLAIAAMLPQWGLA